MLKMPGKSYTGELPPLTSAQVSLREELRRDVETLAGQIGERNIWHYQNLTAAADFLEASLTEAGHKVQRQNFRAEDKTCCNIEAEITGTKYPDQIIIIGAHYDSVYGSPGANDNASAVAAALAIARRFADKKTDRTLRFVFFANEEPPFFQTDRMGSLVYAKSCREKKEKIIAMLSLETIGYYNDQPNSQQYPFPLNFFHPSTADFVGFVGNLSSRKLLHKVLASFRENCKFPSEAGAYPEIIPGINWSDHCSFWRQGYPAIMITDTAPFRYPYYHAPEDTPDKIDYDSLTRVTTGLQTVIADLDCGPQLSR
jgi:Zn-dependent M28 family amino/carboxypeptidase